MNGIGYIYKITNQVDGKIYVGKTNYSVHSRWLSHIRTGSIYKDLNKKSSLLYNAINKYGIENFTIEQIDECPIEELGDRERYWIERLDARNHEVGYNICRGGECGPGGPQFAGHKHSEETKAKMSADRKGEKNSNYGHHRVMPEDEKMKHAHLGSSNGMYGKQHSEASKEKNREAHLGTIWITNGEQNLHIKEEDAQLYLMSGLGWRRGMSKITK